MGGVRFTCEIDGLDQLATDWESACAVLADGVNRGVERGVTEGADEAKSTHRYKDKTGRLTGSIRGYLERSAARAAGGEAIGIIEATAPYASFVESGTNPHDIWPKAGEGTVGPLRQGQSRRKKTDIGTHRVALRWDENGVVHFARMVHHPGSQASPFIGPAVLKAERVIEVEVELAAERAAEIMNR